MPDKLESSDEQVVAGGLQWRKIAEAVFLLASLGGAVFLLGPTLKMTFGSSNGPIGPGSAPLITLILILAFTLWIAASAIIKSRRGVPQSDDALDESSTKFVVTSSCIFIGLVIFIYCWKLTNFPVTAVIFAAILSVALQPRNWRTLKRSLFSSAVSAATVLAVWALFEFFLKIRLH